MTAGALRRGRAPLDAQREQRPVGEPGQRVVTRLVREPLLELCDGRERARGLAPLERAAGVSAHRLEHAPLAQAERHAALHGEQADDARLAAQRDDDRGRQPSPVSPMRRSGRLPERSITDAHASSSKSARSGSVVSPVNERRARSRPSTCARRTRPSAVCSTSAAPAAPTSERACSSSTPAAASVPAAACTSRMIASSDSTSER